MQGASLASHLPWCNGAYGAASAREVVGWKVKRVGAQLILQPQAGFLPLWISVMAGVTPGCLSVYTVYFIKDLEQSRQDFSSCLPFLWSH